MSHHYTLTDPGTIPVEVPTFRSYLKLESDADDALLTLLLKSATEFAEKYTRRDLRVNTWTLLIDAFADRIVLRRDPVDSITSVKYLDDQSTPVQQTVAAAVYYLKKGVQTSEILLAPDQEYPDGSTDELTVNEKEHSIEIVFATVAHRCVDQARLGIMRHAAFLYENRGDCDPSVAGSVGDAAELSGASKLYDQLRVSRV